MQSPISVPLILGPTGAGKTSVSHFVALSLKGEVISADSRAVYRGLIIGTATPGQKLQDEIPYHLINFLNPRERYSAMDFRRDVRERVIEINDRANLPIIVGGSRLYINALTEGIFEGPDSDQQLRSHMKKESGKELHRRLTKIDPPSADKIHPNDKKRLIRALEVYELTGRPISELQDEAEPLPFNFIKIGLRRPREDLYDNIDDRVEQMIEAGLVDEVKGLLQEGFCSEWGSWETIGYKEIVKYLRGEWNLERAKEEIKTNTHGLARGQIGWLEKEGDVKWFEMKGKSPREAAGEIVTYLKPRV